MATKWASYALGELQEAFPDLKAGITNCRKIARTNTYSQHSWGNALDIYHKDFGYSTNRKHQAWLDEVHRWIKTYFDELSIRTLLWRVRDHYNHIHADPWPKGYSTPPCAGGRLLMQYNNRTIVSGDPGPAGGTTELPDRELIVVGDAQVLERGDEGRAVADLQRDLITLGYDLGNWDPYSPEYPAGADGQFGGATEDSVTKFQNDWMLHVTGKADGVTFHFIREAVGYAAEMDLKHTHKVSVTGAVTLSGQTSEGILLP